MKAIDMNMWRLTLIAVALALFLPSVAFGQDDPYYYDGDSDGWYEFLDCDDGDANINLSATDYPCDGIDQDCNGGDYCVTIDNDSDGSDFASDCDDNDPNRYPGAYDYACDGIDQDCYDGDYCVVIDNDGDNDGYDFGFDCDDNDPNIKPGATELCNGIDDNCNNQTDEDAGQIWYRDFDSDGFGDNTVTITACSLPEGYTNQAGDCNDDLIYVNPSAYDYPCDGIDQNCNSEDDCVIVDNDNDNDGYDFGFDFGYDCNDDNPNIKPGATELCNGIDDNCDNQIDEEAGQIWYKDFDGDGYGDNLVTITACSLPEGYTNQAGDCNDNLIYVNPAATEICDGEDNDCDGTYNEGLSEIVEICDLTDNNCNGFINEGFSGIIEICDGIDNNCNSQIDEGTGQIWYFDFDGDGYGDNLVTITACTQPQGYVAQGGDCKVQFYSINPGALEVCDYVDNDCDDFTDEGFSEITEICDGIDNNCNFETDEGLGTTWYFDYDGDGYGNTDYPATSCIQPEGYVAQGGDCEVYNASSFPGALEVCDNYDNDCDGSYDEGFSEISEICDGIDNNCNFETDEGLGTIYYYDYDNDGYGNDDEYAVACNEAEAEEFESNGLVLQVQFGECNDENELIYPGATEVCDGEDNDCDNYYDEGVGTNYYNDYDNDGFGNDSYVVVVCDQDQAQGYEDEGFVLTGGDCNDYNENDYPGAVEICDFDDNDCDGETNEGLTEITEICDGIDNNCNYETDEGLGTIYYYDSDNDDYGDNNDYVVACNEAEAEELESDGYILMGGDCNDYDEYINSGATEVCDGDDNDCDGEEDEGLGPIYFYDNDNDDYGDNDDYVVACNESEAEAFVSEGYVLTGGDCNDYDENIYLGALEVCDHEDNDCDGDIDEGLGTIYYNDDDNDDYGDEDYAKIACNEAEAEELVSYGLVLTGGDCDDENQTTYPGATEILCDEIDQNCDGINQCVVDADGDTYDSTVDCDDLNPMINPGATEICNGFDDNCDEQINEGVGTIWYLDADGDTYGEMSEGTLSCKKPLGYVAFSGDCNDELNLVYPGATEVCNGYDDNCNTTIDEGVSYTYYRDADNDTYGKSDITVVACTQPEGFASLKGDCNDQAAAINPGSMEICNGLMVDENCDDQNESMLSCAAPSIVNAPTVVGNTAKFDWSSGCNVRYRFQYRRANMSAWTLFLLPKTTTTKTISNMPNGNYNWALRQQCHSSTIWSPVATGANFSIGGGSQLMMATPEGTPTTLEAFSSPNRKWVIADVKHEGTTTGVLRLIDVMGRPILTERVEIDQYLHHTINTEGIVPGLYYLQLVVSGKGVMSKPVFIAE